MVESGASAEDVAKAMAHHKVMQTVGNSAEKMAQNLLHLLRSGEEISPAALENILKSGGISIESAEKSLAFQHLLGKMAAIDDVASVILAEKKLLEMGVSPENVSKILKHVLGGNDVAKSAELNLNLNGAGHENLSYDDVIKALQFEKTIAQSESADFNLNEETIRALKGVCNQEMIEKVAQELAKNGIFANKTLVQNAANLQKVLSELDIPAVDLAKLISMQKAMYEAGASPQDIALILDNVMKHDLNAVEKLLNKSPLNSVDVSNGVDLINAIQMSSLPVDLVSQVAMLQKSIEASMLTTPEQAALRAAEKMKKVKSDSRQLGRNFQDSSEKCESQSGIARERNSSAKSCELARSEV